MRWMMQLFTKLAAGMARRSLSWCSILGAHQPFLSDALRKKILESKR